METLLSIAIGIGLSAACGFRVFVPLLVISIASMSGHLELAEGFAWIGTSPACTAFAVGTVLEVLAYYIPWVDNLLDAAAAPAAIIAGTVVTAAVVGDMAPFLKWSLAVIAGGGAAGAIHAGTAAVRAASSTTTGGLGNPVVSTGELAGSATLSIVAIAMPLAAVILIVLFFILALKLVRKRRTV